ncbi:unnamed protein product [Lupinus luteus]|uniref:GRAM domain-containing protein n=1 Tax=Lupinus luteus TaxID=3873 RepID=A0AAV1WNK8_LUPLU
MNTKLFHELVIGTPTISKTYDQLEKSVIVSRYLPDPAIQCQYSTTTSNQSKTFFPFTPSNFDGFTYTERLNVLGRVNSITNKLGRKTDSLSQCVENIVSILARSYLCFFVERISLTRFFDLYDSVISGRLAPKISETVKGKLSLGAQILKAGGLERVFKHFLASKDRESLLKVSQCYLSTTSGPLAGFLFISTHKVAFCTERSIKVFNGKGQMCRIRYKVSRDVITYINIYFHL